MYLGNHRSIIKALAPFYTKEEFKDSQEFLKKELKKIISTIQDKLIKHNDKNEITFKKNKLKNIVELYAENLSPVVRHQKFSYFQALVFSDFWHEVKLI